MSGRFTTETAASATRRRKKRFGCERERLQQKIRSTSNGKKRAKLVIQTTNRKFMQSSYSGGANNVMSCAGIEMLTVRLDEARKFNRRSVFVDFGCSAGSLCLHVAQRYGCTCYGVEKEAEPLGLAVNTAKALGLSELCNFIEGDFTEPQFANNWLEKIGATHVFAYDKVFSKRTWEKLFGDILTNCRTPLVGANCALKRGCKLPVCFEKIGSPTRPAILVGGKSGYALQIWSKP